MLIHLKYKTEKKRRTKVYTGITICCSCFNNILHYMDVKSICYFMQLSKDNFTLISESYIESKQILNLNIDTLPFNIIDI